MSADDLGDGAIEGSRIEHPPEARPDLERAERAGLIDRIVGRSFLSRVVDGNIKALKQIIEA